MKRRIGRQEEGSLGWQGADKVECEDSWDRISKGNVERVIHRCDAQ
jgi:hypothetical protein